MRVFISEYLTCGAVHPIGENAASLAVEGAAMLRALAEDAAAIQGISIDVTWSRNLPPFGVDGVSVHAIDSPSEESLQFHKLARETDATIIIAPEFDQILETRCRAVGRVGGHVLGPTADAIALCSDKLALSAHFMERGIPTIPTQVCDFTTLKRQLAGERKPSFVVKPRFGAGSIATFHIRSESDIEAARRAFKPEGTSTAPIIQPYIYGESLSIAAIVKDDQVELLPICRQHISASRELHYLGGSVPRSTLCDERIRDVARRAIAAVPGLAGYIGLDLILPAVDASEREALVVEINPRLTSSYHGYRRLTRENLARRLINPDKEKQRITWLNEIYDYFPDGTTNTAGL